MSLDAPKTSKLLCAVLFFLLLISGREAAAQSEERGVALVIHGGAGTILPGNMTPDLEQEYQDKLTEALRAGYAVLERGGASLDAVITSIQILEASPLFNAGVGAVFTSEGT